MRLSLRPAQTPTRRVLVTGAASGLGLALVHRFADRGDRVLATDLGTERPAALPPSADYLPLDVRDDQAWARALAHVQDDWSGLDLLVNNAGIGASGRIDVATMDEWAAIIDVNLLGVVRGCRTFSPLFKGQGSGQIVNTASLAGLIHPPGMAPYNAVKAGVVALSETLSHELGPFGITVTVVCPAFFRSNLGGSTAGADTQTAAAGTAMLAGAKRSADDVAAVVIRGIDARKDLILPDPESQILWRVKRFAAPVYAHGMRRAALRLKQGRAAPTGVREALFG